MDRKKKIKEYFENNLDDKIVGPAISKARTSPDMLQRWAEYCGVDDPDKIDYENPMVKIEYWLCDFKLYDLALEDPKLFCETLGCDYEVFQKEYSQLPTHEDRAKAFKKEVKRKINPLKKRNKSKQ